MKEKTPLGTPFILNVLADFVVAVGGCANANPIKRVKIVVTVMATTAILILFLDTDNSLFVNLYISQSCMEKLS
jgi:hypothetical protein